MRGQQQTGTPGLHLAGVHLGKSHQATQVRVDYPDAAPPRDTTRDATDLEAVINRLRSSVIDAVHLRERLSVLYGRFVGFNAAADNGDSQLAEAAPGHIASLQHLLEGLAEANSQSFKLIDALGAII